MLPKLAATKKTPNRENIAVGRIFTQADRANAISDIVTIQIQDPTNIPIGIRRLSESQENPPWSVCTAMRSNTGIQVMSEVSVRRKESLTTMYSCFESGRLRNKGRALLARSGAIRFGPMNVTSKNDRYVSIEKILRKKLPSICRNLMNSRFKAPAAPALWRK